MRFALTTAVVAAIALLAVANGQSTDCVSDVLDYCTYTYSPTTSCCNIVRKLYRTDRSCLCLIFSNATKSYKDLVTLLQGCDESISVADTYVCSSGSFDTSQYYEVNTTTESIKVDFLSKLKLSRTAFIGIVVGVGTVVSVFVIMLVCALIPRRIKLPPPPPPAQLIGYPQQLAAAPLQLQLQGYPQPVVVEAQLQVQGYNQSSSKNQSYGMPQGPSQPTTIVGSSCTIFTYEDLMKASNEFSSENLLGRGGSGVVYRGTLNGIQVAIKQFIAKSLMEIEDFKIEIERITHLHHKNLVSLVGYCCTKDKMLMVLELVPNGTLESHLHKDIDVKTTAATLSPQRFPIKSLFPPNPSSSSFLPVQHNNNLLLRRQKSLAVVAYKVSVEHEGKTTVIDVDEDETILSRALDEGLDIPHDCKLGVYMTCPARLVKGAVDQGEGMLSDDVVEKGYTLLCVPYPKSDCTIRTIPEEELLSLQLATADD